MRRLITTFFVILSIISSALLIQGCSNSNSNETITDVSQINGKKIGVLLGSFYEANIMRDYPDSEIYYYNTLNDSIIALESGKVAAVANDEIPAIEATENNSNITYLDTPIATFDYGFAFAKNTKGEILLSEFNKFLQSIIDDGTLDKLIDEWLNSDNRELDIDYDTLPNINGVIHYAANATVKPFAYFEGDRYVGLDIEILTMYCKSYGYALTMENTTLISMLSGIGSKYDIISCGLTITEERKETVNFSIPYYSSKGVFNVLKDTSEDENTFSRSFIKSFRKTFITDNRWKLFAEGIATTLIITLSSLILGTILGFFMTLTCRHKNRLMMKLTGILRYVVLYMPIVVLLLIVNFVIFGSMSINNVIVSIICFTIVFTLNVFTIINNALDTIDKGQTEAALTLGYKERDAFFSIVFPQAFKHCIAPYNSACNELILSTAIVGYIAVQDLTQAGDIIRSQTYDAFFPLFAIAIIYYLLALVIIKIIKIIENRIDFNAAQKRIIKKGINYDRT